MKSFSCDIYHQNLMNKREQNNENPKITQNLPLISLK
jgi:hypothetical protein